MFHIVKFSDLTHCHGATFSTFASDMGWKPGEWPEFLFVMRDDANGAIFRRSVSFVANAESGEFGGYYYISNRLTVQVFND